MWSRKSEQIFGWLKGQGAKTFDFSRISPGAYETNSVYIFKDSAGGYPMQYLGDMDLKTPHTASVLLLQFFLAPQA